MAYRAQKLAPCLAEIALTDTQRTPIPTQLLSLCRYGVSTESLDGGLATESRACQLVLHRARRQAQISLSTFASFASPLEMSVEFPAPNAHLPQEALSKDYYAKLTQEIKLKNAHYQLVHERDR